MGGWLLFGQGPPTLETSLVLKGQIGTVSELAWLPNSKILATGSYQVSDGIVRLWNTQGQTLATLSGYQCCIESLDWSPDGKILAAGSRGSNGDSVQLWDANGKMLATLKGHEDNLLELGGFGIDWSPDGKMLAIGSHHKKARLWLWQINREVDLTGFASDSSILSVKWSPDGEFLAAGSDDKTVRLWQLKDIKTAIAKN